jgi:DNA-binding beta-propeller fold protein YncE
MSRTLLTRVAVAFAAVGALAAARGPVLTRLPAIALPSVEGRIDHLAFDPAAGRLFVAALGHNSVEVVDLAKGSVTSLSGFREPQGIALAPDQTLVAIANGQGTGIQFVDAANLSPARAVQLGDDSDNVRYDAVAKRFYVGYGDGALAAVDPVSGAVLGRVTLPAHPEAFQLESGSPRVYVNLPDARQIAVVDRSSMKVTASWPVTAAAANFPMALDEAGHRLFVGCRRPANLLVYDTRSGKSTASAEIVGDTDDLFFDAVRRRVYVIGGDGSIDVLDVSGATPSRLERIPTAAGARTGLFVASVNRLFLAVPRRGVQRAEIRVFEVN